VASPEIAFAKGESDENSFGCFSYWMDGRDRTDLCGAGGRAVWRDFAGSGLAGHEGGVECGEPLGRRDFPGANAAVGERNGERNNQNMGGDPAVGADKILGIQARNYQGQSRAFTFKEGGVIDASQFYSYGGGVGVGPGPGWQVMFADWGAGNRRANVTDRVRVLLSGNGMVRVNNQNMGLDPAVGADKTLRISARDGRGQVREFRYKEGSSIDASQFYNYGGYPGGGGGLPPRPGPGPNPGYGDLQIVRAYYGLNQRTNDVTQRMRGMVNNGSLVVQVNNNNMGGDPAPGADKVLTVIYRVNGREQTSTVKEGNMRRIP
jgi:hypothetical protein